jgi:hypothetical protein
VVVVVVVAEVTEAVEAVAVVVVAETIETTITAGRGVVWRASREESLIILVGEVAASTTKVLPAVLSTPHRKTENCRAAGGSQVMYLEATVNRRKAARLAVIRLSISRNVRLELRSDLPV